MVGFVAGCSSAGSDDPTVAGGGAPASTTVGAASPSSSASSQRSGDPFAAAVPMDVSKVTVTVQRLRGAPTVERVLGTLQARQLAAAVNGLGPRKPGVNCLVRSGFTDTLRFVADSQAWTVHLNPDPCGSVAVSAPSASTAVPLQLAGADALDRAVLAVLGLPADYGH
jgi:hypothetical protein